MAIKTIHRGEWSFDVARDGWWLEQWRTTARTREEIAQAFAAVAEAAVLCTPDMTRVSVGFDAVTLTVVIPEDADREWFARVQRDADRAIGRAMIRAIDEIDGRARS